MLFPTEIPQGFESPALQHPRRIPAGSRLGLLPWSQQDTSRDVLEVAADTANSKWDDSARVRADFSGQMVKVPGESQAASSSQPVQEQSFALCTWTMRLGNCKSLELLPTRASVFTAGVVSSHSNDEILDCIGFLCKTVTYFPGRIFKKRRKGGVSSKE